MTMNSLGVMIDKINRLRPITGDEVFHYVSMDKSKYMLNPQGDIFCGHSNFMNDTLESWTGCLEFLKYLKKNLSPEPYSVLEYNLRENSAQAKLTTKGYSYFMPYVWCVMPERDSVYQWRNYTDKQKGGYCFGFNLNLLQKTIECRNARYGMFSSIFMAPCFYIGKDDDLIDAFMTAFIGEVADDLKNIQDNFQTGKDVQSICNVIGAIFTLAPLFKDKKWHREQEYRLILKKAPVLIGQSYERSHLSDICEHPYNLMSSITISPHGDRSELIHNLQSQIAIEPKKIFYSEINRTVTDYYISQEKINSDYEEKYVLECTSKDKTASIMSQEEYKVNKSMEEPFHV